MTDKEFAKSLLAGIEKTKKKINNDERATAEYWNADDWGSMSGIKDANEWEENQIVEYVVKRIKKRDAKPCK